MLRTPCHNNLPNFIGHYFPRRDDPETENLYHASMLMLLKPWHNILTDLKNPEQTWKEAFLLFVNGPENQEKRVNNILSGIQYFHDCKSSSDSDHHPRDVAGPSGALDMYEDELTDENRDQYEVGLSEETFQDVIAAQTPINKILHMRFAIEIARLADIFQNDNPCWPIQHPSSVSNASGNDLTRLLEWKRQL